MKRINKGIGILLSLLLIFAYLCGEYITYGIIDETLSLYDGVTVVLDAGHGGKDKGAEYDGINEKDLNLKIVEKTKKELEKLGMNVILTREGEDDLASSTAKNRKKEDMKRRMKMINDEQVDFFISIHLNAYADEQVNGLQIFYPKGDDDSKYFASHIKKALSNLDVKQMKNRVGDYYLLNHSKKIGILLECGFLSNPMERDKLANESYQRDLAISLRKGITSFMNEVYE